MVLPVFKRQGGRGAFALVVALLLMFFVVALGISLSLFLTLNFHLSEANIKIRKTRLLEEQIARLQLAKLQMATGRDSVITVEKSNGNENEQPWVYAVDCEGKEIPLVSNDGVFQNDEKAVFDLPNGKKAVVPWQYSKTGDYRFASIVIDEGVRPSLGAFPPPDFKFDRHLKQLVIDKDFSHWFRNLDFKNIHINHTGKYDYQYLSKDLTSENSIFDFTGATYTVLADWPRERLKQDLSNPDHDKTLFGDALKENTAFFNAPDNGLQISKTLETPTGEWGFSPQIFPFPLETKLHIVFFNARTDGQHRAKFYITTSFWNPYPFPLTAQNKGYFALTDWANLPAVRLENLNTGAFYEWSLSGFPEGKFGNAKQTKSDRTFNAYNYVFDRSTPGLDKNKDGFHAGEIYIARWPDPDSQPQGLSRITGMPTWKRSTNKNIEKPPSGVAGPDRWFHDQHKIVIKTVPDSGSGNFVLRAYRGNLPSALDPSEYSEAMIEFKNIPVPAFSIEMTGAEYNRATANVNTITDAHVVLSLRLRIEDSDAILDFLKNHDFRDSVFDFNDETVAKAFEVKIFTGEEAREQAKWQDSPERLLFDEDLNSHGNAFAYFPFFDLPNCSPLSAGTLRHFYWSRLPKSSIGTASNIAVSKKVNEIFDKFYFSGLDYTDGNVDFSEWDCKIPYFLKSGNFDKKTKNPEEHLFAAGTLNVNSKHPEAWESLFRNFYENWRHSPRRENSETLSFDDSKTHHLKNVVFTRPFSAQASVPNKDNEIFSDKELSEQTLLKASRALITQGLRQLDSEKIKKFSECIVNEISDLHKNGVFFHSLEQFANSNVLQRAVEKAEFNDFGQVVTPSWIPNCIAQETLFDGIVPVIAPRSDTFRIVIRIEKLNPLTQALEAVSFLETLVQRFPEPFEEEIFKVLGRKYKRRCFRRF